MTKAEGRQPNPTGRKQKAAYEMDRELRQRIYDVADAVWQLYWDAIPTPHYHHYDSWGPGALDAIGEQAVTLYVQTIRDTCAEVGVNERDYWLAEPSEALRMRPACLADELDQIRADLKAEMEQAERDFVPF